MSGPPILDRMRGALSTIWRKSHEAMLGRVTLVEDAALRLLDGELSEEGRRAAERAAHQMAGTCGTFGFMQATELAREAEQLLAGSDPVALPGVFRLTEIAIALRDQLTEELPSASVPATSTPTPTPASASASASAVAMAAAVPTVNEPVLHGEEVGGELILALDDDPGALEIISAVLTPAGYRVMATCDPALFFELLSVHAPDMVILDVDMPDLTGVEVCGRLRSDRRWVALPVMFLTARADADSVARLFEAGADDYALKPVVGPELVARVRNRLVRSRLPRMTVATVPSAAATTDIVIVDDDQVLVGLLQQSLATGGYSTLSFADGPSALEALTAGESGVVTVRARVVVLDVGLPGMDGLTVLRALARQGVTKLSRVVMLTARTTEEEVVQALELGAFDHVTKPFSVPILLQRIRRAFDAAGVAP